MATRDRLLGRSIPPTVVTIRADFSPESDAAQAEVDAASLALQQAQASGVDISAARERLAAAEEAMAPFVEVLEVTTLPPDEYDALVAEHPPTPEQKARGAAWNTDTFVPALLAACLRQDGEPVMSAEDWAEWARTPGAVTSGEYVTLANLCIQANDRSPELAVKKGYGGRRS